jgi:hypothetical protein
MAEINGNSNLVAGDSGINQSNVIQQQQVVVDLSLQNA